MIKRRIITFFLIFLLFILPAVSFYASQADNDKIIVTDYEIPNDDSLETESAHILLYSAFDKRVIYKKDADEVISPASTVKLTSAILIYEKFKDSLDTNVTVTKELLEGKSGLSIYLEAGEVLSIRELLTTLLIHGANDVSTILAHYYMQDEEKGEDGDLAAYAALMTEKAKEIGCENTIYKNVTGLHESGVKTTLWDVIKIAEYAASLPGFTEFTSVDRLIIKKSDTTSQHTVLSRNYLISSYLNPSYKTSGVNGMNFGSTDETGECLVVSAEYEGKKYFMVITGGTADAEGRQTVFSDAIKLIDHARNDFGYIDVLKKGVVITQVNVRFSSNTDTVTLVPSKTVSMYLPTKTNISEEITFKTIVTQNEIDAPVNEGDKEGDVIVYYNGSEVCRVPLVTTTSVSQSRILYILYRIELFVKQPVFIGSAAAFIVLLIIYVIIKSIVLGKKKKKKRIK